MNSQKLATDPVGGPASLAGPLEGVVAVGDQAN